GGQRLVPRAGRRLPPPPRANPRRHLRARDRRRRGAAVGLRPRLRAGGQRLQRLAAVSGRPPAGARAQRGHRVQPPRPGLGGRSADDRARGRGRAPPAELAPRRDARVAGLRRAGRRSGAARGGDGRAQPRRRARGRPPRTGHDPARPAALHGALDTSAPRRRERRPGGRRPRPAAARRRRLGGGAPDHRGRRLRRRDREVRAHRPGGGHGRALRLRQRLPSLQRQLHALRPDDHGRRPSHPPGVHVPRLRPGDRARRGDGAPAPRDARGRSGAAGGRAAGGADPPWRAQRLDSRADRGPHPRAPHGGHDAVDVGCGALPRARVRALGDRRGALRGGRRAGPGDRGRL
ncbi:MAG: hypothetical protein AVDCRST_MAG17-1743, partial [uncultured Solirubrobacterales bacterium]